MHTCTRFFVASILGTCAIFASCASRFEASASASAELAQPTAVSGSPRIEKPASFTRRDLVLAGPATSTPAWLGHGVSYGPFRDGQQPGGALPTKEQVREDLKILAKHWSLLRMYGSRGVSETVCEVIHEDKLPLKVLVGAWIVPETTPATIADNKAEVQKAIDLANKYPGEVWAVSIGNETMVEWSDHRVAPDLIINYIKQARAAVKVPVTTCDDYNFWNKPESVAVGKECDFVSVHIYAMWNKQQLADAMDWSRSTLASIKANHPNIPVVITEIGWATNKGTNGYQAIGIVTTPDEREQELFFRSLRDWAQQNKQPYFYFSAFDENWKGGTEPNEVEKNWGVFKADRSPKKVMKP